MCEMVSVGRNGGDVNATMMRGMKGGREKEARKGKRRVLSCICYYIYQFAVCVLATDSEMNFGFT